MAIYCSIGDSKAVVTWKWKEDSNNRKYESKKVPIKVEIEQVNVDGQTGMGTWSMNTYDNSTLPPGNPFSYRGNSTESPITVDLRKIYTTGTNRLLYSDGSTNAGAIQYLNVKFTPDPVTKYQIIISDINGSQLFKDEKLTDTPPKYEVACGDECPEGQCKCPTPGYPGYCCLDCAEVAQKIRNLSAKVGKCCG